MMELLHQYGWLIMCVIVMGLLVGWAWWFYVDRAKLAAKAGFTLVNAEQYKKEGEELIALRKLNHEFEREIASLKDDKPKPERMKPVIDWIALNAVYVDYDADSRELEVGWINKDGMGHSTLYDLSERQARELGEDFKAAIKSNHQPARFA